MKYLAILACAVMLFGCGGGGSSSGGGDAVVANGVPQLSMQLDSRQVKRGENIYGTLGWADSEADITEVHWDEYFGPVRWNHVTAPSQVGINGTSGQSRVVIYTSSTGGAGIHTFKFYLRDRKGQQSNVVEINVGVSAMATEKETEVKMPLAVYMQR